ncbi:MAG: 7-cyano-7-deazaguanine synthase QueC [Fimbriimonadaceae bacterium]|nr:7-cyano-7-deazaguanine synthase QueC [Fimbriimonadaceae bacterium]
MKKAVVLFSGGLDSTTVLAMASRDGFDPFPLTVAYGQRHQVEVEAARRAAAAMGFRAPKVVNIDLTALGGSALTADIPVPKDRDEGSMTDIPVTYVPARNTVLLSLALAYAEVLGADDIFCGVNAVDYSGYPDCRPAFVEAFGQLANVATKRAVEGNRLTMHAPLLHLTKRQVIEEGLRLDVDYGLTHSCYDPDPTGAACGHCDSCLIRKRAFGELGLEDPVLVRS